VKKIAAAAKTAAKPVKLTPRAELPVDKKIFVDQRRQSSPRLHRSAQAGGEADGRPRQDRGRVSQGRRRGGDAAQQRQAGIAKLT